MTKPRTFTTTVSIELIGDKGYGAELQVEVEFTCSPFVPAVLYGDHPQPEEGGEREIVNVRPFTTAPAVGPWPEERQYLECPKWLEDILFACIDPDELTCEEDNDE